MSQYQLFEALRPEEYDALSKDIEKRGVQVPIEMDEEGNVLDGHHRLLIADSLGIEAPKQVRHFATEEQKIEHVLKLNLLRRHLGPVSWAKAFEKLLTLRGVAQGQGSRNDLTSATVAEVADEVGVAERTARHRLQVAEQLAERPDLIEQVDTGALSVRDAVAATNGAHVANNAGDHEWYTPDRFIAAARTVMGGIDLDPASTSEANEVVGAEHFYTEKEDGRKRHWEGRVWMNPPYSWPAVGHFCDKLAEHYSQGDVSQACVLVNNATETSWFQTLAEVAAAFCFIAKRVEFWHPRKKSSPLQGQAVVYLGPDPELFCKTFVDFGFTAVPC